MKGSKAQAMAMFSHTSSSSSDIENYGMANHVIKANEAGTVKQEMMEELELGTFEQEGEDAQTVSIMFAKSPYKYCKTISLNVLNIVVGYKHTLTIMWVLMGAIILQCILYVIIEAACMPAVYKKRIKRNDMEFILSVVSNDTIDYRFYLNYARSVKLWDNI